MKHKVTGVTGDSTARIEFFATLCLALQGLMDLSGF